MKRIKIPIADRFDFSAILSVHLPAVSPTIKQKHGNNELFLVFKDDSWLLFNSFDERLVDSGNISSFFKANEDFESEFYNETKKVLGKTIIKYFPNVKEVWIAYL